MRGNVTCRLYGHDWGCLFCHRCGARWVDATRWRLRLGSDTRTDRDGTR